MGTLGQKATHSQIPPGLVGSRTLTPPIASCSWILISATTGRPRRHNSGYKVLTKKQNGKILQEQPENCRGVYNGDRPVSSRGRDLSHLSRHARQIQVHEIRRLY